MAPAAPLVAPWTGVQREVRKVTIAAAAIIDAPSYRYHPINHVANASFWPRRPYHQMAMRGE